MLQISLKLASLYCKIIKIENRWFVLQISLKFAVSRCDQLADCETFQHCSFLIFFPKNSCFRIEKLFILLDVTHESISIEAVVERQINFDQGC